MTGDTGGMFGDLPFSSAGAQVDVVVRALLLRLSDQARARVLGVTGTPVDAWLAATWEVTPGGLRGSLPGAAVLLLIPGGLLDDNPASFTCSVFGPGGQVKVIVSGASCDMQESLPW